MNDSVATIATMLGHQQDQMDSVVRGVQELFRRLTGIDGDEDDIPPTRPNSPASSESGTEDPYRPLGVNTTRCTTDGYIRDEDDEEIEFKCGALPGADVNTAPHVDSRVGATNYSYPFDGIGSTHKLTANTCLLGAGQSEDVECRSAIKSSNSGIEKHTPDDAVKTASLTFREWQKQRAPSSANVNSIENIQTKRRQRFDTPIAGPEAQGGHEWVDRDMTMPSGRQKDGLPPPADMMKPCRTSTGRKTKDPYVTPVRTRKQRGPTTTDSDRPWPLRRERHLKGQEDFDRYFGDRKPRKEKEPAKYNGKTSWEDFVNQFEACRRYNQWTDEQASFQLFASCTGEALTALTVNEFQPEEMTYDELKEVMSQEFGPRECAESYFLELSRREQGPNESLYSLAQDIRKLTIRAHPRTDRVERDRVARECFKKAITDPEVRKDVFRARPETLNQTIQVAMECESYYRAERSRSRSKTTTYARVLGSDPPQGTQTPQDSNGDLRQRIEELEAKLAKYVAPTDQGSYGRRNVQRPATGTSRRNQPYTFRCYRCDEQGHFARDCPRQGNEQRPTQRAMGRPAEATGPEMQGNSNSQEKEPIKM